MKTKLLLSKKSKLILSFLIFFAIANVQAQYTLIPDSNFEKQLIQKNLDDVIDGKVLTANINTIENFAIHYTTVEDITGIEDFTALKDLTVYYVGLKKVDLTHNKALESINFGYNNLRSFDLSQNTALKKAYVSDNLLTTLDFHNNPNLEDVFLGGPLVNLNMANGNNDKITRFSSQNANLLSCIKVDNIAVTTKTVSDGDGGSIPVWQTSSSISTVFSTADCGVYTPIPDAGFEYYLIANGIDTNTTPDSKVLTSDIAGITTIDFTGDYNPVGDFTGLQDFAALTHFKYNRGGEDVFSSIDLSQNTNLTFLEIKDNNNLTNIDISQNIQLQELNITDGGLTKLDISKNPYITKLSCYNNPNLTALNLKGRADKTAFETNNTFNSNPKLTCIEVDDIDYATANWLNKDTTASYYSAGCPSTAIPDQNFEQVLINNGYDDVIDGKVITVNIAGVDYLYVSYNNINDLTGIEGFTSLTTLEANGNNLTSLDLSKNTLLTTLSANNNQLNTLDVSKNLALTELNFENNLITDIDVTNNTALQYLFCGYNKIAKIDISKNNNLTQLGANNNPLVNVNLKGNTNNIYYLDLTNTPSLSCIEVDDLNYANNGPHSQWKKDASASYSEVSCDVYTSIPDAAFEQLLIDKNIDSGVVDGKVLTHEINALTSLSIYDSSIADFTGLQDFATLTSLDLINNVNLTTLDLSKNTQLTNLSSYNNHLVTLDLSKNTQLTHVDCRNNNLTNINVSKNTELVYLLVNNNALASLDVSKNTKLIDFYCVDNQLTSLDVSKNTALTALDLGNNKVTTLDVSNNTELRYLNCYSNQLVTLDVSQNTQLTNFNCQNNNLTTVNLKNGNNTNLVVVNEAAKGLKNKAVMYPIGTFGFQANDPALVILVDSKSYSDTNWMAYKDASAVYQENVSLGTGGNIFETIAIAPNPTHGELYINNIALEKVTVFSLLGNVVKTIQFNGDNTTSTVNLSDLTAGLYLVKLSSNGLEKTVKVLKK